MNSPTKNRRRTISKVSTSPTAGAGFDLGSVSVVGALRLSLDFSRDRGMSLSVSA
jgi:hypothetical protein